MEALRVRYLLAAFFLLACGGDSNPTPTPDSGHDAASDDGAVEAGVDAEAMGDSSVMEDAGADATSDDAALAADGAEPSTDASVSDADLADADLIDADLIDAGADAGPLVPQGCDAEARAIATAQLVAARLSADGPAALTVSNALVTAVVPGASLFPASFVVQAEPMGPALLIQVDPASLSPAPRPGDCVALRIDQMATVTGARAATAISAFSVIGVGHDVTPLIQEVSAVTDLETNVESYEYELISVVGTIANSFLTVNPDNGLVQFSTTGIPGGSLTLEARHAVVDALDLVETCELRVSGGLLSRYNQHADVFVWRTDEVEVLSCPAPRVTRALAVNATTVSVRFDRRVDPATLNAQGLQFVFTGGLQATGAVLASDGRTVTVTTGPQTAGVAYTVVVATTLRDTVGAALESGATSAAFLGYQAPAIVRLNEINPSIASSCDLVELRVVQGGSMEGFELWDRAESLVTFRLLAVETHDRIVVHFGSEVACGRSDNEVDSVDQQAATLYPQNYDAAYDWYVTVTTGLTNTTNVLVLRDTHGTMVDAFLGSDGPTGTVAAPTEAAAAQVAAAQQWTAQNGSIPATGYVDDAFREHSVQSFGGTATTAAGNSVQRVDDADRNRSSDWTLAPSTWGSLNAGQSDL